MQKRWGGAGVPLRLRACINELSLGISRIGIHQLDLKIRIYYASVLVFIIFKCTIAKAFERKQCCLQNKVTLLTMRWNTARGEQNVNTPKRTLVKKLNNGRLRQIKTPPTPGMFWISFSELREHSSLCLRNSMVGFCPPLIYLNPKKTPKQIDEIADSFGHIKQTYFSQSGW